jgi:hypothetical protein
MFTQKVSENDKKPFQVDAAGRRSDAVEKNRDATNNAHTINIHTTQLKSDFIVCFFFVRLSRVHQVSHQVSFQCANQDFFCFVLIRFSNHAIKKRVKKKKREIRRIQSQFQSRKVFRLRKTHTRAEPRSRAHRLLLIARGRA